MRAGLFLGIGGLVAALFLAPGIAAAKEHPARAGSSGLDALRSMKVLALDPFDGKAAVQFAGARLWVLTEGEELPAAPGAAAPAAVRFRITDVLPDRLVLEEIAVEEPGGAAAARRQVWVYKPSRPGLESRIEILERNHPVPFVPDQNPATEMPEEPGARSARNPPSATGEEGGG